jgi:hypothetical protein
LFLNQANVGIVPAFVPVAVNVTPAPEQTLVAELEIVILAVGIGLTLMFTTFDEAVVFNKQVGKVPPAVSFASTASPF